MYMPINAGFQKIFIRMEVWEWPTHKKGISMTLQQIIFVGMSSYESLIQST